MYEMFMEDGRGERWDDPFYFIQNAMGLVGDQARMYQDAYDFNLGNIDEAEDAGAIGSYGDNQFWTSEYDKYESVTFNIWLFKGAHHFI